MPNWTLNSSEAGQLQAGLAAEEALQLPPRDTHGIEKDERAEQKDIEMGRRLGQTKGNDT